MNKTETDELECGLSYCQMPEYLADQKRKNQQARALWAWLATASNVKLVRNPNHPKTVI